MRIAIGDIHGCLTSLETLLDTIQPSTDDLIVTLGDYVDRGQIQKESLTDYSPSRQPITIST